MGRSCNLSDCLAVVYTLQYSYFVKSLNFSVIRVLTASLGDLMKSLNFLGRGLALGVRFYSCRL